GTSVADRYRRPSRLLERGSIQPGLQARHRTVARVDQTKRRCARLPFVTSPISFSVRLATTCRSTLSGWTRAATRLKHSRCEEARISLCGCFPTRVRLRSLVEMDEKPRSLDGR